MASSFEDELRQMLPNLYNPACPLPDAIVQGLRPLAGEDAVAIRQAIIAQIEDLRPGPQVPQTARVRRLYQVLHLRYVEQWTQQRTADELGVTVRHLAREQARAIALLADRLARAAALEPTAIDPGRSALHQSLASLELGSGPAVSDLGSATRRACQLVQVLAQAREVAVEPAPSEPGTMIAVRPSVLVQILVHALTQIVVHVAQGSKIMVDARESATDGIFRMISDHYVGDHPAKQDWSAELVQSQRGQVRWQRSGPNAEIEIAFPLASKHVVLVIDDNPDLIHYYRQCVANAPYELHGVTEGCAAVQRAEELRPDIIVLDLMLPDVDGWDILEQLQAQETLRDVPIVISSVVSEEELALALGAALCLTKPVRRAAFVAALDAALGHH